MNVLVVEDNEADRLLVKTAFERITKEGRLDAVQDGSEALKYLHNEAPYQAAAKPNLILLDRNLPGKHGREVLEDIRKDPELRNIPVVILSSSTARRDICETYHLHASCYVVKPHNFMELTQYMKCLHDCWLSNSRYCACPSAN